MDASLALSSDVGKLCALALSIGFIHTLCGPDHYVPFVAMSQARRWSLAKTVWVTLLCGFGHVGSSILLGFLGVALGIFVLQLEMIEAWRGDIAGWLLLAFGLLYFIWGLVHAARRAPHRHVAISLKGIQVWQHEHQTAANHGGRVDDAPRVQTLTPWVVAIVFVLGPCEPLIPMLMYPAAKAHALAVFYVAALFALATLVTMTVMVVIMRMGVRRLRLAGLQNYAHAACGFAFLSCGLMMTLGL